MASRAAFGPRAVVWRPCPKQNPNPTLLPKHQALSRNHKFSQRFRYAEYYSVHQC